MKTKNILTIAGLIILIGFAALYGRKSHELKQVQEQVLNDSIQAEKQQVNDSIALLNRLLVLENQKYINVMIALDSISRKGGVLGYTNFDNKQFELYLTPKQ